MSDTQNQPDILINNWRWWIAESDTLMREWDCAYMHNLDGRSDPSVLKLNNEVRNIQSTWSWLWISIIDSLVRCNNWEVYIIWWWLQWTAPWQILAVTKFSIKDTVTPSIYLWFYRVWNNILSFAIPISTVWTALFWSASTNYWIVWDYQLGNNFPFSEPTSNDSIYTINYEDDFLYFSVGKKIFVMNQPFCNASQWRMEYYFSLEDDIKWLTRSWYLMNIYLRNWLKYFWQWIENRTTTWSIDLWIKRVQWVSEWKNFDYIVWVWYTWESNCLFVSQWQDIQLLKEWNYITDWLNNLSKFYIEATTSNKNRSTFNHNLAFFPMVWDQWIGVISLWTRNEITSKSWINEYIDSNIDEIWSIIFAWDANYNPELYMCIMVWWQGRVYSMDFIRKNNWIKYQPSWVRYTKKYIRPRTKQWVITRFRFRYDNPAQCNIEVAYAINWSSNYTILGNLPQSELDFEWINMDWRTDPRYEIQFRITMSTTDDTKTPKLYIMEWYESNANRS